VRLAALLLAAALAGALPLEAEVPDPRAAGLEPKERLQALIDRVKLEQSGVRTLEARFLQRQESEFFVEPVESRGLFSYAAPDRVRWEYESPKPVTMVIDGKEMTTWYRDLGRVDVMKVGRYSERVLRYLGASGSMETLLQYFDVEAAFPRDVSQPYRLELTPRFARVAKKLRSLTLWLDPQRFVPSRLRYVSGDGGTTDYAFDRLVVNGGLPADRFKLALPAGVEVRVVNLDRAP
jgi:outer membrane lipoprotein-sorting protein